MTRIRRWDPFREVAHVRYPFDTLFGRGFGRPWRLFAWEATESPFPVDLYETDDEVVVKASLPGVQPDETEISVTGRFLTIKGERKEEDAEEKSNYFRQERRYGAFQRSLRLPVRVDAEQADATLDEGVLTVRLPKAAESRAKTIPVTAKAVINGDESS